MESRKIRDKTEDTTRRRRNELDEQDFEGFAALPELKD
jgi:hypothetical protein